MRAERLCGRAGDCEDDGQQELAVAERAPEDGARHAHLRTAAPDVNWRTTRIQYCTVDCIRKRQLELVRTMATGYSRTTVSDSLTTVRVLYCVYSQ